MSSRISQTPGQWSGAPSGKLLINTPARGNNSKDKVIKRRASRACQCCRERKVRCNIVEYGPPCTNCRLDNVTCIAAENKRKRRRNLSYIQSQRQTSELHDSLIPHFEIPDCEENLNNTVNPAEVMNFDFGDLSDTGNVNNERDTEKTAQYDFLQMTCQESIGELDDVEFPLTNDLDHSSPSLSFDLADHKNLFSSKMTLVQTTVPEKSIPQATYTLPPYLNELPKHLTTDEIEILMRKSAFSIPENGLRYQLLQAYIEYVHPCMPLVNIRELLQTLQTNGTSGKISLMLFQAIMFVGTAFIDMSQLHAVGFANRREAQNTFYQRCRILYDVDYESNYITLIQSLILMTYSPCSPDDPKGARHWLDIAISLAYRIGLHRNSGKSNLDLKKQRLLKRIWWTCLMCDRLVALEIKGLATITDADFDIPMLTLADFEIEVLPLDKNIVASNFPLIQDKKLQTELALICIEKAKLCLYIGHVIYLQYSLMNKDDKNYKQQLEQGGENLYPTSSLTPQPWHPKHVEKVLDCDFELSTWLKSLPWPLGLDSLLSEQHNQIQPRIRAVLLHQSFLHILYSAALSALHEPQSISISGLTSLPNGRDLHDLSLLRVYTACKNITSVGLQLHTLFLTPFLPTTAIAILVPAIARHLSDLQISISSSAHSNDDYNICGTHDRNIVYYENCGADEDEDDIVLKRTGRQRSNQCVQLLESLQCAFPTTAASHAIRVLGIAAAATSPAKVYRSDIDLTLALATRDVKRRRMSEMSKASTAGSTTEGSRSGTGSVSSGSTVTSRSVRSESIVSSGCCSRSIGSIGSSGSSIANIDSYSTTPMVDETDANPFSPVFTAMSCGSVGTTPIDSAHALQYPMYLNSVSTSTTKTSPAPHKFNHDSDLSACPHEPLSRSQHQQNYGPFTTTTTAAAASDILTHLLSTTTPSEESQYSEDETSTIITSPNLYLSTYSPAVPSQSSANPFKNPYSPSSLSLNYSVCGMPDGERSTLEVDPKTWGEGARTIEDEDVFKDKHMDENENEDVDGNCDGEEEEEEEEEEEGEDCGSSICSRSDCADFGI